MTTKTVAVQLIAMTQQYKTAMAGATASTAKLQGAATGTGNVIGKVMGPQIALGAAVVAGAAVKMAYDWDNAFTRIAAVTDTSQAQVAQWKNEVLTLAGKTARAPQELADALYFLASAGLDANEVMPTLEASAKAAAVGLGKTADIARLTANAMNAYSASGLTATQVTDTLVAAVREGTAEPDEFADAMGRILPIASKAGISFDQVAASLASLSNIGLDVNEGVTAMRGVMVALLAPGKQAADTLASLGLSADEVRRSLAEDGLIATLRLLEAATGGNIDMLRKIVPNVRAMTGAFGLTGQEAAKVDEIFRDVMESTASLNDSFGKTEDSAGHKLRKALVDLQVVMTKLGENLLPVAVEGLSVLAQAAENVRIKVGGLARGYDAFADVLGAAFVPGERFRQLYEDIRDAVASGELPVSKAIDAIDRLGDMGAISADQMEDLRNEVSEVTGGMQRADMVAGGYTGNLAGVGVAAEETVAPVEGLGKGLGKANDEMADAAKLADKLSGKLKRLAGVALDAEDASIEWAQSIADMREELRSGTKTLDIFTQAGRDNRIAIRDAIDAAIEHGAARAAESGSLEKGIKVVRDHIVQLREEAIQAGFSKREIDAYIRTLELTPANINTLLNLRADKAKNDLESFRNKLDAIPGVKDVLIRVTSTGMGTGQQIGHAGGEIGKLPAFHSGGRVGLRSDEVPLIARRGEWLLTAQQYASMRAASGGGTPSQVSMPSMPSVQNTIVVQAGDKKLAEFVVDALRGEILREAS